MKNAGREKRSEICMLLRRKKVLSVLEYSAFCAGSGAGVIFCSIKKTHTVLNTVSGCRDRGWNL